MNGVKGLKDERVKGGKGWKVERGKGWKGGKGKVLPLTPLTFKPLNLYYLYILSINTEK